MEQTPNNVRASETAGSLPYWEKQVKLGFQTEPNVVLEVANEFGHDGFDRRVLKTAEG
jgi:hypothetical protein